MVRPPVRRHYLKTTKSDWTPDVVAYFDTETRERHDGDNLSLTLRCWVLQAHIRHDAFPELPRVWTRTGTTAAELAEMVSGAAEQVRHLWAIAHNVSFDLAVTELPPLLVAMGWHLDGCSVASDSSWWAFRRDGCTITLADSWSWLTCSLETAARDIGKRKVRLPDNDASLRSWLRRCRGDVELLATLMNTVFDWWDAQRIGRIGLTGASSGWAAMRRMLPRKRLVVGAEPGRTEFERQALYGGRRQVFRVGEIKGTTTADYDFQTAYLRIAAHLPLPERCLGHFDTLPPDVQPGRMHARDVIARCRVTAIEPVTPCRIGGDVWWASGTTEAILCGPEIAWAEDNGAKVEVLDGWLYLTGKALMPWGVWCLEILHAAHGTVPPPVQRMAKGWARSVVGRFASHTSRIAYDRQATRPGWHLETGQQLGTGRPLDVLTIGGRELTIYHDLDAQDTFPAITAFVESHCRVALARMMQARDPRRLLQCNTDGWWEERAVRSSAYEVADVPYPHIVVRKQLAREVLILGPDHLTNHVWRRMAGVPADAERDESGRFRWHDWPSLRYQLENSPQGVYTRPPRSLSLQRHYARCWVLTSGETVPVTVRWTPDGGNEVLPWSATVGRLEGDRLATWQDPRLEPLADATEAAPVILSDPAPVRFGRVNWHSLRPYPVTT